MLIAYKYRLYPNKLQEELVQKTFGCCRFVYNKVLDYKINAYKNENKSLSRYDCNNYKNQVLKKEFTFLKEVDKFALDNTVINLDSAYNHFFKEHTGFPKFKSKYDNHKSYKTNFTNNNIIVDFENNKVKLPKLKWVKCKLHREFIGKIKSATVSQVPSGKYYISILVEQEDYRPLEKTNNKIGIDLGLKEFAICSNGDIYSNPKHLQKSEKKLAKLQRQLSKKKKGSKNFEKQRLKVAKCYEKITNQRKDFLHKTSKKLTTENDVIALETLKIKNMLKNHKLAKNISDVSWYEFVRQITYKCEWFGRKIIQISTWFPSSQLCSNCGYQTKETKNLSVREWICPTCHTVHERDINASINILNEGLRLLEVK